MVRPGTAVARVGPHPVHPGVDLQVDGHGREPPAAATRPSGRPPGGVHGGDQPAGHGLGHGLRRRLGQQEDRRLDAGLAQGHPLFDQGHRQPGGPAFQRGPGHGHGAVAVAVGLDHGAQRGRDGRAGRATRRCGARRRGRCRPRPAASGQPRAPADRPSRAAEARAARRPPARAGRRPPGPPPGPEHRPDRGRGRPGRPPPGEATPRASKAPITPDRTSPVPAVARAVRPGQRQQDPAVGVGHGRGRPLQQRHRRRDAGQRPGGAMRSGPGAAASQPRRTRRRGGSAPPGSGPASGPSASIRPRANSPSASTTTGTGDSATRRGHLGGGRGIAAEARADHHGRAPRRRLQGLRRPALGGQGHAHRLGGRCLGQPGTRARRAGPCRHRPGRPPGRTGRRRRSSPATRPPPARRPTTCCRLGSAAGPEAATSASSTTAMAGAPGGEADVDHRHLAGQAGAVPLEQAGLEGDEGDRAVGGRRRSRRRTGVAVHPGGDVDGQHRHPGGHRRSPVLAPEPGAVGGVDDQVAAGPIGTVDPASTTATRAPRRRSTRAATRPSAPLLPGPATTTTRRP